MRARLLIYVSLILNGILFFHQPLFSSGYSFPWDFRSVQTPLMSFLAEELSKGRFALWDPFTYCGNPIYANIQASFFHPLVFVTAWVTSQTSLDSLSIMLEWVVVLQICFAAIITFHVFREYGIGAPAAWAGAAIFETGGYFASRTEHIGAVMAVAWMPLAWLAVSKLGKRVDRRWLGLLGLALGMSVFGGLPAATLAVFISAVLAASSLVVLKIVKPRLIFLTFLGAALGIGLSSVIFIPAFQLTQLSVAKYRADWLGTGGGLYWQSLVSLIWPDYYHIFDISKFKGPWDFTFLYLYGSFAGLLLAVYALLWVRSRLAVFFGIVGLLGASFMLGDKTIFWNTTYPLMPQFVRIGVHPEYTYCIFTFAMAGLAAVGLDSLNIPNMARWFVAVIIAADLFLVGSGRPMNTANVALEPGLTRHTFDGSEKLLSGIRKLVNSSVPPARIDTMDASIDWSQSATLTRVPTASGVSPLALESIIQLRLLLHQGTRWGWYYPVERIDSPVLDAANVKYLLTSVSGAGRLAQSARFRHVATLPGVEVFENQGTMPRCLPAKTIQRVASAEEAQHLIESRLVDLHQTALVYDSVMLPESPGKATIHFDEYEPTRVAISVKTPTATFIVLSDAYYPGWRAQIDSTPATLYETDIAFRGMVVPAGRHQITMQFRPTIFYISAALSIIFAALLCWLIIF